MATKFYDWYVLKYGNYLPEFDYLDEEFQDKILAEYASIVASY